MFSVIIPVYQSKDSLIRCVRSWLRQTCGELELILVDDGSTDGSGRVCDLLAEEDRRIRVIHQANAGVSAARNAGIRAASGEFVLFTDSDDYVETDYLEKMGALQRESDADLVLCGFHHIYDGADILKLPGETAVLEWEQASEKFLELYEKGYLNMPWNKLFRRAWMDAFDTGLSLGEDLLFNLSYLRKCKRVAVLAEPLCYYIQEEKKLTLSSQKRQNRMELARLVCERTEKYYRDTWGKEPGGRIFSRYLSEILDECEKLPADRSLSGKEKLAVIRGYAGDSWALARGDEARLYYADHRLIWQFLKRKQVGMVYLLCVWRRWLVVVVHRMRRRKNDGSFD